MQQSCGSLFNVMLALPVSQSIDTELSVHPSGGFGVSRAQCCSRTAANLCHGFVASTCSQLQQFISERKEEMTPVFLPLCSLTAPMLPAAGTAWTMKQEQNQLSATDERGIGGETEKGMRMVSPVPFSLFFV